MTIEFVKYDFNDYIIEIHPDAKHSLFEEAECRGIDIFDGTFRYEIINCLLGERLLINCSETYHSRDLPFNLSTAHFLPDFVKVKKRHESI